MNNQPMVFGVKMTAESQIEHDMVLASEFYAMKSAFLLAKAEAERWEEIARREHYAWSQCLPNCTCLRKAFDE